MSKFVLAEDYFVLIHDLMNSTTELVIDTQFCKDGISFEDFRCFLETYYRLIKSFPENVMDLLVELN